MMRPFVFRVSPAPASSVVATTAVPGPGVHVTWRNNALVPAATDFVVQRADDTAFTVNVLSSTVGAAATSWTDGSAAAGSTYHYRVRAENSVSYSVWSADTSVTVAPPH